MKVMANQKITAVTSTSEDANYPDDNILDEHPKKLWKAASGQHEATLTFSITNGSAGIAIFNTNALSISATVTDANAISWYTADVDWSSDAAWVAEDALLSNEVYNLDGEAGSAWLEWATSPVTVSAAITFTASSEGTVQAGVAVSDAVHEFTCPDMGVNEGLKSYDIVKELQNGAFYTKQRDTVREFSFSFTEDRAIDFYEFMYTVSRELGFEPAAWWLADMDDYWWVVYARFSRMPSGSHSMPNHSAIRTQLIEVL
jgi:hypothetical protein